MSVAASNRSRERRMSALRQANHVRSLRAKLKRDLREGTARLEQILATGADYLASAEVFDLLIAVPKIGPVKANHLLTLARINPSKTVGQLTEPATGLPHQVAEPLAHDGIPLVFRGRGLGMQDLLGVALAAAA